MAGSEAGEADQDGTTGARVEARGYRIRGRVQGVGFRWWTRQVAEQLGLAGTVRNCPDGTVEVRVRGGRSQVEELEERLGQGPNTARVEEVERLPEDPELTRDDFEIVR